MSKEEIHTLAGFQAAILQEEGQETTAVAKSDLRRFYPAYILAEAADSKPKKSGRLFKQRSVEAKQPALREEFEKSLEEAEKKLKKTDAYQLKVLYLQLCWHKPFYGSVMFVGYTKKPFKPIYLLTNNEKLVTVAVNMECVHLFSSTTPPVSDTYMRTYIPLHAILNTKMLCTEGGGGGKSLVQGYTPIYIHTIGIAGMFPDW